MASIVENSATIMLRKRTHDQISTANTPNPYRLDRSVFKKVNNHTNVKRAKLVPTTSSSPSPPTGMTISPSPPYTNSNHGSSSEIIDLTDDSNLTPDHGSSSEIIDLTDDSNLASNQGSSSETVDFDLVQDAYPVK